MLNGDEAVARGAIEAGVRVAASYPGTPSTEIFEAIADVSKERGIYAEWSVNEMVATGVAAGAAMSGVRSIVSMKHVGLNVASDAVMTLAYTGVVGGMVIAVCDDPSMHSSQNEQDTRYFAVHASLPLLDAGDPKEAKDMTFEAFDLSEKLMLPVIVRLTTRVSHGKGRVKLGDLQKIEREAKFDKDGSRWTMIPSNARERHRALYERFRDAVELAEVSGFNIIENNGSEVGVIGSGIGYHYARSILDGGGYSWLKLGFVNPFPDGLVKKFAEEKSKIVVIEELRPFIENNVRRLNSGTIGKGELGLEELGELTPDILRKSLAEIGLCEGAEEPYDLKLPSRPPVLCPGCPHRALYYALNKVREDKIVTGDIGCYTLGVLPPLNAIQTCLCMGAGISQAAGMWHAGVEDTVFAVIGDSTFFHAGMPHLLNLAYNKAKVCVVIMDNETVAMTGHQPTPESGRRAAGEKSKVIGIDNIAYSLGIDLVNVIDPYDIDDTVKAIKESINHDGPSVIISKRLCSLVVERGPVRMVSDECSSCGICVRSLGCPSISMTPEGARIDPILCRGCGVCESICPLNAIRSKAR